MIERKDGAAPALVSVEPNATLRQALALINTYNISQLPVCDSGHCLGSLAESTLMARVIEDPAVLDRRVEEVMDEPLPVVDAATPMSGVGRMLTRQNPAVLVASDGVLRGIITRYDVVRYLTQ